jgi:hypothetical protein
MLYSVRIRLSEEDWDAAVHEASGAIEQYKHSVYLLSARKLNVIFRTIMKVALRPHHAWLSERQITAVISPYCDQERVFAFYFETRAQAQAFHDQFAVARGTT